MGVEIAIGIAAGSAVAGIFAGEKSRREAKKSAKVDRKIQDLQTRRERSRVLAEAQSVRASAQQQAASGGVQGASTSQQGIDSVTQQANTNLAFVDKISNLQAESSKRLEKASDYAQHAQTAASVGSFATRFVGG